MSYKSGILDNTIGPFARLCRTRGCKAVFGVSLGLFFTGITAGVVKRGREVELPPEPDIN